MCSINFIYGKEKGLDLNSCINKMNLATKHRGSDTTTTVIRDFYALGFNRLKLIGGAKGKQPIVTKDGNYELICNGEIYNYQKLKKMLKKKYTFVTSSDVEIIIPLYQKYGYKCLVLLEGQFSFVLVDRSGKKIFFARDRVGINPLFYSNQNGKLIISSEIKGIISSGITAPININPLSLAETIFFYGPIPPKTCFKDIYQLPPAHFAAYNCTTKKIKTNPYYELFKNNFNEKNEKKKLEKTLKDSIKKRLMGDSKIGVYIGGGLDSSLVAYYAKKLSKKKVFLFSLSFPNSKYDESYYQEIISSYLKLPLNKLNVSDHQIFINLEKGVYHCETPLIRTAPIPLILLSKKVRESGVKFVLCGEGADEFFAGYPVFLKNLSSIENRWKENLKYLKIFKSNLIKQHILDEYRRLLNESKPYTVIDRIRKREIITKLSSYLLSSQGDRVAMANGVEQRFPYLDTELMNLAMKMKDKHLLNKSEGKIPLRKIARKYLPLEIANRKKQGYLTDDIKVAELMLKNQKYKKILSENYLKRDGIFNFFEVQAIMDRFIKRKEKSLHDARILMFITTSLILQKIFKTL